MTPPLRSPCPRLSDPLCRGHDTHELWGHRGARLYPKELRTHGHSPRDQTAHTARTPMFAVAECSGP